MSKLTKEQAGHNSAVHTGVNILHRDRARLCLKIDGIEADLNFYRRCQGSDLCKARCVVLEDDLRISEAILKQTTKCIEILKSNLIKGE